MDKKLSLFEVTVGIDKIFADYYDEAVEQLKGEGFFTSSPYIPECPLWIFWELVQDKHNDWRFEGQLRAESLAAAKECVNKTMPRDSAAWRYRTSLDIKDVTESDNVNDGEFVRIVIDGEPATYSYKFEVEQRFVLDHEDELKLSKAEARWWRNHGTNDANISDWQMWEALLIHTVREDKNFADLIK